MRRDADIVVIGAGIVGAATARALAGWAGSVLLLEQFELGHTRGSSHGTSRIFRLNYPDQRFVRLARAADAAWRDLERERAEKLVDRVGCLDLGPVAAETSRALTACGVPFETLSADEVAAHWPVRLAPEETAVFQPDGGTTYADRAHAALIGAALDGGVELRERTPVRSLSFEPGAVRLSLDDREISTRAVVVTAGPWAAGLLAPLGIDLPVVPTCETVVYLQLEGADRVPPVIDYGRRPTHGEAGFLRAGQASYALASPGVGLKAGLHHAGRAADPDEPSAPDERLAAWISEWAAERYEGVGSVIRSEACLYTNTADEGFILERHGRVVVGSACSGHGFKFAPVVGRTLAALARAAAA